MSELRYEGHGVPGNQKKHVVVRTMKDIFYNVLILCGMAIAVAVTVKVIMSLFA